jgi:hypothetical protein
MCTRVRAWAPVAVVVATGTPFLADTRFGNVAAHNFGKLAFDTSFFLCNGYYCDQT